MKKSSMLAVLLVVGLVGLVACGGGSSSDTSSDSPAVTSLAELPKATSPMASASASLSKAGISKAAVTGLNLLSAATTSFESTDSMAACQTFNVLKDTIVSAAQADQILCYVQNMNDAFGIVTDANAVPINVYDGGWHIFNMNIEGGQEGGPDKVKMQIVKNAAGSITSFKMYMCKIDASITTSEACTTAEGTWSGGKCKVQNEYTDETIDGTSFTMAAKGRWAGAEWSGSHQVDVTGTLNSSNVFTQKQIVMKNTGGATGDATNTNWQEATVVQTLGLATISGYQTGNFSNGASTNSYQEAAYGEIQMLGDTSDLLASLAMGDGAVFVDARYAFVDPGMGSATYDPAATVFAWLGDTLAAVDPATGSNYYTAAAAGTIPTVATSVAFAFSTDQAWDCSDDVATAVTLPAVDETSLNTACSQYGNMARGWINCYEAIGQYVNPDSPALATPPAGAYATDEGCGFPTVIIFDAPAAGTTFATMGSDVQFEYNGVNCANPSAGGADCESCTITTDGNLTAFTNCQPGGGDPCTIVFTAQ